MSRRPGDAWPGTGMVAAPQTQEGGQLPSEVGWPCCPQPHPSGLVHRCAAPQWDWPCARTLTLATQSDLPGSFLPPGDFSAVRSYDCSLKGRALLAEGGYKIFTVQAIKVQDSMMVLPSFPMCVHAVFTSHCHR